MKNFLRRRLPLVAMCLAISWLFQGPANANDQPWPSGPIKIIVGFAPGGTSDVTARIVGEALSKLLGQPVLVEDRPGAQGAIATDTVVRSRPDGYTLLVAPAEALYMPLVDSNARLDIEKTLAPVTILSTQPIVVAVNPSSEAVQDLLSGVVPVGILGSAPLMPYVKSGRVTLLAVTSKERSTMLPTVPALAELGYPEIDMTQWFAVFAPAETPKDIVERLSADLRKVLAEPEVKERLGLAALEPVGGSSEEFSKRLQAEGTTWLRTARAFGMGKN